MSIHQERDWATKMEMRMRLIQAAMADAHPEERRNLVREEMRDAIRELSTLETDDVRIAGLDALEKRFPFLLSFPQDKAQPTVPVTEAPPATAAPSQSPRTVDQLVDELVEASRFLSNERRADVMGRLQRAGLAPEVVQGSPASAAGVSDLGLPISIPMEGDERMRLERIVERMAEKLQMPQKGGQPAAVNLNRCMQLLGLMVEQYLVLHPVIWGLWDHLSAGNGHTTSFNKPSIPARQSLSDFLQDGPVTNKNDVGAMVMKSFYLVNALVSAAGESGRDFADWFFQKFGPENIEALVNLETGRTRPGPAEYWQRYCELSKNHSDAAMEDQFQRLLGQAMLTHIQRRPRES